MNEVALENILVYENIDLNIQERKLSKWKNNMREAAACKKEKRRQHQRTKLFPFETSHPLRLELKDVALWNIPVYDIDLNIKNDHKHYQDIIIKGVKERQSAEVKDVKQQNSKLST